MTGQRSIEPKPTATGDEKILQIPEREFIQTRDKVSLVVYVPIHRVARARSTQLDLS
jgi:hypothetical protein